MAGEMMRLAAAALLGTFPNTTMTVAYTRGPGWVSPQRYAGPRRSSMLTPASPSPWPGSLPSRA
jgi:hypothetical protein